MTMPNQSLANNSPNKDTTQQDSMHKDMADNETLHKEIMHGTLVGTPRYVLLADSQRIGPKMMVAHGGPAYKADYGFSDSKPYDTFIANSEQQLRPYPLVPGYLKNQLELEDAQFHLIVVDSTGPEELHLHAVTLKDALDGQQSSATHVKVSFVLVFDPKHHAYRVGESGTDDCLTSMPSNPTSW